MDMFFSKGKTVASGDRWQSNAAKLRTAKLHSVNGMEPKTSDTGPTANQSRIA